MIVKIFTKTIFYQINTQICKEKYMFLSILAGWSRLSGVMYVECGLWSVLEYLLWLVVTCYSLTG